MVIKNPHFDENLVIWKDEYSGRYLPPKYSSQFELQWKIALEGDREYYNAPGVNVDDKYIDDRIYEWTGHHPTAASFFDSSMGVRVLDHPLDIGLIKGKKCIDIGCGMGRWTRTMMRLGAASVLSVDISESALKSVKKYNPNACRVDIMEIPAMHPELVGQFDFANFWGVAMCTHDPLKAFLSASSTVKSGGALYLMVYAPEGPHGKRLTNIQRKKFAELRTTEEKLALTDHVYRREWDKSYPLIENLKNCAKNILHRPRGYKVGFLDMLEPFYNWVIPLDVISGWMNRGGYGEVVVLNENESPKCAFHVLGIKK